MLWNAYTETAAIPPFVGQLYEKHQDRLVYGTDMSASLDTYRFTFRVLESADEHVYAWNLSSYHWPLCGLILNDQILQKVYRTNAMKVLQQR